MKLLGILHATMMMMSPKSAPPRPAKPRYRVRYGQNLPKALPMYYVERRRWFGWQRIRAEYHRSMAIQFAEDMAREEGVVWRG